MSPDFQINHQKSNYTKARRGRCLGHENIFKSLPAVEPKTACVQSRAHAINQCCTSPVATIELDYSRLFSHVTVLLRLTRMYENYIKFISRLYSFPGFQRDQSDADFMKIGWLEEKLWVFKTGHYFLVIITVISVIQFYTTLLRIWHAILSCDHEKNWDRMINKKFQCSCIGGRTR